MKRLERYGRWAIVVGASEGIGGAYAECFAEAKRDLVLIARRKAVLEQRAHELSLRYGIGVRTLSIDMGKSGSAEHIDKATASLDVGVLVYNAALSLIGPFLDHPLDRHLVEIDVNCRSPLSLAHRFGKRFVKQGRGAIVLMSSMSATQGSPYIANYAATKAYNLALAEGLWYEFALHGVDVIASCAGATDTPNFRKSSPTSAMGALPPKVVANGTLRMLGRTPSYIPGRVNRLLAFIMRRILPHKFAVNVMGNTLSSMYGIAKRKKV
ncbi:MAG: SDR family NAD(P)-dependent oxidoreductase [Spirochaetota bacterium]